MKSGGAFLVRLPLSLKIDLVELAKREGVSLNQLMNLVLANAVGRSLAGSLGMEVQDAKC